MSADPNVIDVWEAFLDPQTDYSLPDFAAVTPETLLTAVHTATDFARAEVAAIVADDAESTFFSTTVRFESASVPMTRIASVAAAIESNHLRPELTDAIGETWNSCRPPRPSSCSTSTSSTASNRSRSPTSTPRTNVSTN